ncbi:MAG TPA: DUF5606 domain-containing protein [Bacteroidales bacterium]|nr:DUF5606 domain-containing protein [Bacteroidales bacterium]
MNLKDILSISGKPGLYKFVSQAKNGIIVESVTDKKRIPAYAADKVSALDDIAIFTETGEAKLSEVFDRIYEKEDGGQAVNHKSGAGELKAYFEEILPDYDQDRVYVSDIKKVFSWYNLLQEQDMLIPSEEEKEDGEEEEEKPEEKETESDTE